jgi:hypothetical protein
VAQAFAGFVVGYALAIVAGGAGAIALIRSSERSGFAQRVAPPGTSVIALSVVIHFTAMLVLTAIGLLLGVALAGIDDRRPDGGLGSPNLAYTLLVVALVAVIVIPTLAVTRIRRIAIICGIASTVAFGWAMPWLAEFG